MHITTTRIPASPGTPPAQPRAVRTAPLATRTAALLLAASALTAGLGVGVAGSALAVSTMSTRPPAVHPAGTTEQRYAEAVQAFQAQRYSVAYGRFAALADDGHASAALMALALVRYAPVFGAEWSATPAQIQDWTALATQDIRVAGALIARHDRGE
jgi:hypothetical protein